MLMTKDEGTVLEQINSEAHAEYSAKPSRSFDYLICVDKESDVFYATKLLKSVRGFLERRCIRRRLISGIKRQGYGVEFLSYPTREITSIH